MTKIGVCFGGYCPLHQGHLDEIMRAKKENDHTFVIVAGYDDDRGGELLPLDKRFRIISNFLSGELVTVLYINDTELGLDESMSDSNWDIWLDKAYDLMCRCFYKKEYDSLGFLFYEFNWYVGEFSYKRQIERYTKEFVDYPWVSVNCILMDRNINPISGSQCRETPLKYWDKISTPFRSYYSHNILITGTASEGKTTLTQDLGKYFNLPYSYEKGRDICKLKPEPEFTVKDYIYNLYEQHKYNEELINSSWNPGVFISDSDNLVTLMYAKGAAEKKDFVLSEEDYELLYNIAAAYAKTTKWDKIFLIKPREKDIVDDGERYMPDSPYEIRLKYYNHLLSLYKTFGYEDKLVILDGSYYENWCVVCNYIKEVMEC